MNEDLPARAAAPAPLLVCMQCGFTHAEFRTRGLLGCPACYDHFGAALRADMLHIHPQLYRAPAAPENAGAGSEDAAAWREQLADALRLERYEEAAALQRRLEARADARSGQNDPTTPFTSPPSPPRTPSPVSGDATAVPDAAAFATTPVPWAHAQRGSASPQLLFVRVTARRNFAGFPFWVSSTPEACARLAGTFFAAARSRGFGAGFRLADVGPEAIGVWRERMLLPERPASFPGKREHKVWLPGPNHEEHLLFGETEQWTRSRLAVPQAPSHTETGLASQPTPREAFDPFARALAIAREWADDARDPLFALAESWGFLTSQPAHAGPGLQADAGVHLPALAALRRVPQIAQAMAAVGCELQPLSLRVPGAAEAGFFRLVSRGGMGLDAAGVVGRFREQVAGVLDAERRAHDHLTRDARARHEFEDRAHRALNLLQEARRMDTPELQLLVSHVRAGVYAGLFPHALLPSLETLRVLAGPAHIASRHRAAHAAREEGPSGGSDDLRDDDRQRADLARHLLSGI